MVNEVGKVAFIGLGRIGAGMAINILKAGFELAVYNRTQSKMRPLLNEGAAGASSPKEAATGADVALTCLMDDQSVLDVVRPGITTADVASQWPSALELGFASEVEARGLEVGHGIGLSNHEKPFISRMFSLDNPIPIETGMHFALETFAGEGEDGARIESQLIVTEDGHRVITRWPCEELVICNPR